MANKTKLINIRVMYQDRNQLLNIFEKMTHHIRRGVEEKSDSWTLNDSYCWYHFSQEFPFRYDYTERHINGSVCYVYKSKL